MNNILYPRLAGVNIGKHKKLYTPYIISSVITICMFYIMMAINTNPGLSHMRGAAILPEATLMAVVVIGIFACIFLLYTNSFIIKQRKEEFGLYNVLGMEKKHIAVILFFETLYTYILSVIGGVAFGILFDKLTTLLLCKLLKFEIQLGFQVSVQGIIASAAAFGFIFLLSLAINIIKIYRLNPVELLHGGDVGEKEPKTKMVSAILGVLFLATGYIIAIVTKSPLKAITLFLLAVLCVIFGTYLLFTAGSIAVLKLLKKNKTYYYNKKHFNTVSGMLYRMKQNAVGLANICILSTMVLVTVSATVSLYFGTEASLKERFPHEIQFSFSPFSYVDSEEGGMELHPEYAEEAVNRLLQTAKDNQIPLTNFTHFSYLFMDLAFDSDTFYNDDLAFGSTIPVYVFSADDYQKLTGKTASLQPDEALVYSYGKASVGERFTLFGKTYTVSEHLSSFEGVSSFQYLVTEMDFIVVADDTEKMRIFDAFLAEREYALIYTEAIFFDISGTQEDLAAQSDLFLQTVYELDADLEFSSMNFESRSENRTNFYELNGSFLFLGIMLGALFLMVTVMIIYYKQVSEGYSDRERFIIMQKVGMSRAEVKSTIHSQVLTVFFLPLLTAFIHLAFSYPIVKRLLRLFGLMNSTVFIFCLIATAVAFALIYFIVYMRTARTYYKIVSR